MDEEVGGGEVAGVGEIGSGGGAGIGAEGVLGKGAGETVDVCIGRVGVVGSIVEGVGICTGAIPSDGTVVGTLAWWFITTVFPLLGVGFAVIVDIVCATFRLVGLAVTIETAVPVLFSFTKFVPYVVYMSGRVAYNVNKKYAKKDMGPSFMLVGYVCRKYSTGWYV